MSELFIDRIAAVRQRFSARLDARIDGIEAATPGHGEVDPGILVQAHRDAHHLCGVGATLGYFETGRVARSIEQMLIAAVKSERTLTNDEISYLRDGIALLRSTASAEMGAPQ